MRLTRRVLMGGGLAALCLAPPRAVAAPVVEITMRGRPDGSRVWFDPIGIHVEPGQTIRWQNLDPGNAHTATAYHPQNGRPLRMPETAPPWDSGYLLPEESFELRLVEEGVYDYFCIPHEAAGMVGRIIVGRPATASFGPAAEVGLSQAALDAFPAVTEILAKGRVERG